MLVNPYELHTIKFETTTFCNIKCNFCTNPALEKRHRISFTNFLFLWGQVIKFRPKRVSFTGLGESLLVKDIYKMISVVEDMGVTTSLVTNGMLLYKYSDDIIASNLSRLAVSIESLNINRFERNRVGVSLDKILQGIDILNKALIGQKKKFDIGILSTLLHDTTIEESIDIAKYCLEIGIECPSFYPVYSYNKLEYTNHEYWNCQKMDELNKCLNNMFSDRKKIYLCREHYLLDSKAKGTGYGKLFCNEPFGTVVFGADGWIGGCNESIFHEKPDIPDNWKSEGWCFSDTWSGEGFSNLRTGLEKGCVNGNCQQCAAYRIPVDECY